MLDSNVLNFTYQGLVNISYEVNGKKVKLKKHNAGLQAMFKFLTKILSGDLSTAQNDIPTFLDVRCRWSDGVEEKIESVLYSVLSISDPSYEFNTALKTWITTFKIVLSYNMINFDYIEKNVPSNADVLFFLVSNAGTDFATLTLDKDDIQLTDIVPGTQALIEWTMVFANK